VSRRQFCRFLAAVLLGAGLASVGIPDRPALAVEPGEIMSDAGLEARARDLSTGLRCLVCQNQSIDDSNAPLAKDLRLLVRERLKAGDLDKEVVAYIVSRYGEFVLLKPPFNPSTYLLWLSPILLLAALTFALARAGGFALSKASSVIQVQPLSDEEEAALSKLRNGDQSGV
jgi:cytochrome c-type biogenesis protein CcmH